MTQKDTCIFCRIINGSAPSHKIWENSNHIAFLSMFPNTKGFSVVVPKQHYPSYLFNLPDQVVTDLVLAAGEVARLLDAKLEDVGCTGMILEGFGVDHLHAKMFPMHGTKDAEWHQRKLNIDKYFEKYEGYISSHDYKRANDDMLAELAKMISE